MVLTLIYVFLIMTTFFNKNALACLAIKRDDSNSTFHTFKKVSDPNLRNPHKAVEDGNIKKIENEALESIFHTLSSNQTKYSVESEDESKVNVLTISKQVFNQLEGTEFTNWPDDMDCTYIHQILSSPYMSQLIETEEKKNLNIPIRCLPQILNREISSRASANMKKLKTCQQLNSNSMSKNKNLLIPISSHTENKSIRKVSRPSNVHVSINLNVKSSNEPPCHSHVPSHNKNTALNENYGPVQSTNNDHSPLSKCRLKNAGDKKKTSCHDNLYSLSYPQTSNININISVHLSNSNQQRNKLRKKGSACMNQSHEIDSCNQKENDQRIRSTSDKLRCPLLIDNKKPELDLAEKNSTATNTKTSVFSLKNTNATHTGFNSITQRNFGVNCHEKNETMAVTLQECTHLSQTSFSKEKMNAEIDGLDERRTNCLSSCHNETFTTLNQQTNETTENGVDSCICKRVLEKNNSNLSKGNMQIFENSNDAVSINHKESISEQKNYSSWNSTLPQNISLSCYQTHGLNMCDENMKNFTKQAEVGVDTDNVTGSQNISLTCCSPSDVYCSRYEACRHEETIEENVNHTFIGQGATQRFSINETSVLHKKNENITKDVSFQQTKFNSSVSNISVTETNMSNATQSSFNHNVLTIQTERDVSNTSSSQSLDELSRKTIDQQNVTTDVSEKKNQTSITQVKDFFNQELIQNTTTKENTKKEFLQRNSLNGVSESTKNVSVSFSKENKNSTCTTKFTNITTNTSEERNETMSFIHLYHTEFKNISANTNLVNSTKANEYIFQEVERVTNESLNGNVKDSTHKVNASETSSSTRELKPSTTSRIDLSSETQNNEKNEIILNHDVKDTKKLSGGTKNDEKSIESATNVTVIEQSTWIDSKTELFINSNNATEKKNQTRYQTNDAHLNKYISECVKKMSMEECINKLHLHCGNDSSESILKITTLPKLGEEGHLKQTEVLKKTEAQEKNIKVQYYTTQPIEKNESYLSRNISSTAEDNQTNITNNRSMAQRLPESLNKTTSLTKKKCNISATSFLPENHYNIPSQAEIPESFFTFATRRENNSAIDIVKSNTVHNDSISKNVFNTNETTSNTQLLHSCIFQLNTSLITLPSTLPCKLETFVSLSTDSVEIRDSTTHSKLQKNINVTDTLDKENQSSFSNADLRNDESEKKNYSCAKEENGVQQKTKLTNCNLDLGSNLTVIHKDEERRQEKVFDNISTSGIKISLKEEKISTFNGHSTIQHDAHNASFTKNATTLMYFQSSNIQEKSEYEKKESNSSETSVGFGGIEETIKNRCKNTSEKLLISVSQDVLTNIQNSHQVFKDSLNKTKVDISSCNKAHEEFKREPSDFDPSTCETNSTTAECIELNILNSHKKNVLQRNESSIDSLGLLEKERDSRWNKTNTTCSCESKPMKYYSYDGEQCDFEEEDTIVEFEKNTKDALVRFSKDELEQSNIKLGSLDDTITDDIVFIPCVTIRSKTSNAITHLSASPINASTPKNFSSLINALRTLNLSSIRNSTFDRLDGAPSTSEDTRKSSIPQHVAEKLYKLREIMNSQILQVEVKKQNSNTSSHISEVLHQNNQTKRQQQTVRIMAKSDVMLSQSKINESKIAESKTKNQTNEGIYNETTKEERIRQTHASFLAQTNTSVNETLVTTEESHKTSDTFSVIEKKPVKLIFAGIAITGGFLLIFFLVNFSMAKTADIENKKFLTSCIPLNEDDKSLPFSGCRETFVDVENTSFL